jgi:hypothetical protein
LQASLLRLAQQQLVADAASAGADDERDICL